MSLTQDYKEHTVFLDEWIQSSQIVSHELILCVNSFEGKQGLDSHTELNIVVAKRMISSEEFLKKVDSVFSEILEMLDGFNENRARLS